MSSVATTRTRKVLIYFGLAEDPNETVQQRRRSDVGWMIIGPLLLTLFLREDRTTEVALLVGLLLLPAFVFGLAAVFDVGAARARLERHPDLGWSLMAPGASLGFAWLLVPASWSDWIPVAIAVALILPGLVVTLAKRARAPRA